LVEIYIFPIKIDSAGIMSNGPIIIDLVKSSSFSSSDASDTFSESHLNEYDDPNTIIIGNNPINSKHFNILKNGEWFNDEIINSYFCILQEEHKENFYLSTFFYSKLQRENKSEGEGEAAAKGTNWLIKSGIFKKIQMSKYTFIPINLNQSHWVLVLVDIKGSRIQYYDSLLNRKAGKCILKFIGEKLEELSKNNANKRENKKEKENQIIEMMKSLSINNDKTRKDSIIIDKREKDNDNDDSNDKGKGKDSSFSFNLLREIPSHQPQQNNGSSCGSFVCYWAYLKSISKNNDNNDINFSSSFKGNNNDNEKKDSDNNKRSISHTRLFTQFDVLNHNKVIADKFKNYHSRK